MKVYLDPGPGLGMAIWRVARALKDYAPPWVEVVGDLAQADLQVVHALGDGERMPLRSGLSVNTQIPYAMVQYCLRTTETPNTSDWLYVWSNAKLVWSYFDLPALVFEDSGFKLPMENFYYAPLGVDATIFSSTYNRDAPTYLIGTSGYVAATEGIPEWDAVLAAVNRPGAHLGPKLPEHSQQWATYQSLTDRQVAQLWSQCRYVAAMRRVEGFELPGVEGLLCGARPVCFDRPHYSSWYEEHAEYVPESSPAEVIESLLALVEKPYRAVTAGEIAWARDRFSWPKIVGEFWERLEGTV